jgi:hypothetical protein
MVSCSVANGLPSQTDGADAAAVSGRIDVLGSLTSSRSSDSLASRARNAAIAGPEPKALRLSGWTLVRVTSILPITCTRAVVSVVTEDGAEL